MRLMDREHYGPAILLCVVAVAVSLVLFVIDDSGTTAVILLFALGFSGWARFWLPWKEKWTIAFSGGILIGLIVPSLWRLSQP